MARYSDNLNLEIPDGPEGANRAYFERLIGDIDENAVQATNHKISDPDNLFTSEDTNGALIELFQFAGSGKSDMASVIGSPATSTDTFAQLKTKAQNAKNTLASNLTAKGQASQGTESLASLAGKVANVNTGKKFATGTVISSSGSTNFTTRNGVSRSSFTVFVSGLDFSPRKIILVSADSDYAITVDLDAPKHTGSGKSIIYTTFSLDAGASYSYRLQTPASVEGTAFFLPVLGANTTYYWSAYE